MKISFLHTASQLIEDYAATVGQARNQAAGHHRAQVKGAPTIMAIAPTTGPPARLQLGADSVAADEGVGGPGRQCSRSSG
jgi:hypothetical protein